MIKSGGSKGHLADAIMVGILIAVIAAPGYIIALQLWQIISILHLRG